MYYHAACFLLCIYYMGKINTRTQKLCCFITAGFITMYIIYIYILYITCKISNCVDIIIIIIIMSKRDLLRERVSIPRGF